jgi:hypothetical protein
MSPTMVHLGIIAEYQIETRNRLTATRLMRAPEPDLDPTAPGSEEPIGRSALTRITRSGA